MLVIAFARLSVNCPLCFLVLMRDRMRRLVPLVHWIMTVHNEYVAPATQIYTPPFSACRSVHSRSLGLHVTETRGFRYCLLHAAPYMCAVHFCDGENTRAPGEGPDLRNRCEKPDCNRPSADHKFEYCRSLWKPAI
jgi:hypothetical protein